MAHPVPSPSQYGPESTPAGPLPQDTEWTLESTNHELEQRVAEDPDQRERVLLEQRDRALGLLAKAHQTARRWIEMLEADHQRMMADLVGRHQELGDEIQHLHGVIEHRSPDPETLALRQKLAAAEAEIESMRANLVQLNDEREQGVREAEAARLEMLSQVDDAHDEAIRVQAELDEALRLVHETHDRARQEQAHLLEELDALRQEVGRYRKRHALA